jgi:hypothetical protein
VGTFAFTSVWQQGNPTASTLKARGGIFHERRQTSPQVTVKFVVVDQCNRPYAGWNPTLYIENTVCPVTETGIADYSAVYNLPSKTPEKSCEETMKGDIEAIAGLQLNPSDNGAPGKGLTIEILTGLAGYATLYFPATSIAKAIPKLIIGLTAFETIQKLLNIPKSFNLEQDPVAIAICHALHADGWNVHVVGPPPRQLDISIGFITSAANSPVVGTIKVINPDSAQSNCGLANTCIDFTSDSQNCGACGNIVSGFLNIQLLGG